MQLISHDARGGVWEFRFLRFGTAHVAIHLCPGWHILRLSDRSKIAGGGISCYHLHVYAADFDLGFVLLQLGLGSSMADRAPTLSARHLHKQVLMCLCAGVTRAGFLYLIGGVKPDPPPSLMTQANETCLSHRSQHTCHSTGQDPLTPTQRGNVYFWKLGKGWTSGTTG